MRCPGGRSVSTVRAVKSEVSSAAGPGTRRPSLKLSVVEDLTNKRARPADTSPAAMPCGIAGRAVCDLMNAGARQADAPARNVRLLTTPNCRWSNFQGKCEQQFFWELAFWELGI